MPSRDMSYVCFDELNVMSTYVYMRSLEVRSWSLLLNLYTGYFFLCVFLFQLEKVTLNKVVDYIVAFKSFSFFIRKVTWHKKLELGNTNLSQI
jgi:hypothetical protein